MRKIVKQPEPTEWIRHRKTPGAVYESIPELRASLKEEQGYICAYCMQRIPTNEEEQERHKTVTKIEHIICRAKNDVELHLDYNNMVVCCSGISGEYTHCDESKGKKIITFDLFSDPFFQTLSYSIGSGAIKSSNSQWDAEINEVLNLNNKLLKNNRKSVLDAITATFGAKLDWTYRDLRKMRDDWNEKDCNGAYKPYCGIVVWFLDRVIRNRAQHGV